MCQELLDQTHLLRQSTQQSESYPRRYRLRKALSIFHHSTAGRIPTSKDAKGHGRNSSPTHRAFRTSDSAKSPAAASGIRPGTSFLAESYQRSYLTEYPRAPTAESERDPPWARKRRRN